MFLASILGMQGLVLGLVLVIFFFGGRFIPAWLKSIVNFKKSVREGWEVSRCESKKLPNSEG